jgi:3-hydroxyacyl-CoA dehydrogenase / enoyl-CoA hydratase / 3-hydroxybutyryl-CoA epimerase
MTTFKHWRIEQDSDDIMWAYIDRAGSKVNTFNEALLNELTVIVESLEQDKKTKGLVILSAKPTGFVLGADIERFTKVKTLEQAQEFILRAHHLFDKIEKLKMPVVALLNGTALGGGMELALACHYRVALDSPKAKFGLPEVKLGIFPGWGGSVRLPRLIGAIQAMGLMLTGRLISGRAAMKMGVVDALVPERHLKKAARDFVLNKPKRHRPTKLQALTNQLYVRKFLASKMRKQVAQKASKIHYPAPYALIKNWEKYGVSKKAFAGEVSAVSQLILGDCAKNLIRIFFLQQRLKGLGKGVSFKATHVHVIGAGTMGGDIAAWCALRGMRVTLQDRESKFIAPAIKRAVKLYQKKLKKDFLVQPVLDRLIPDVDGHGIAQADVVIEAIFEDLKVKQALFKSLEKQVKPGAILATNTSSIPIDEINQVMKSPERLVGIHFFNPVAMMPLVEIVKGKKTSEAVIEKSIAFVRSIDRLPLPVKSHPGFLVNRCLLPYLSEALVFFEQGIPAPAIDRAAVKFGMPMGPVELADTVGLDVCLHVLKNLAKTFPVTVPEILFEKVEAGKLGLKTGEGFYTFDPKTRKPLKSEDSVSSMSEQDIADRLVMRLLNECAACLREGIVDDADLLDAGMIFGTGFAPFRGGPMHYAKSRGIKEIEMTLAALTKSAGDRYKMDDFWKTLADA